MTEILSSIIVPIGLDEASGPLPVCVGILDAAELWWGLGGICLLGFVWFLGRVSEAVPITPKSWNLVSGAGNLGQLGLLSTLDHGISILSQAKFFHLRAYSLVVGVCLVFRGPEFQPFPSPSQLQLPQLQGGGGARTGISKNQTLRSAFFLSSVPRV